MSAGSRRWALRARSVLPARAPFAEPGSGPHAKPPWSSGDSRGRGLTRSSDSALPSARPRPVILRIVPIHPIAPIRVAIELGDRPAVARRRARLRSGRRDMGEPNRRFGHAGKLGQQIRAVKRRMQKLQYSSELPTIPVKNVHECIEPRAQSAHLSPRSSIWPSAFKASLDNTKASPVRARFRDCRWWTDLEAYRTPWAGSGVSSFENSTVVR